MQLWENGHKNKRINNIKDEKYVFADERMK